MCREWANYPKTDFDLLLLCSRISVFLKMGWDWNTWFIYGLYPFQKWKLVLFIMISFYYIIRIFLFINLDTNYFVSTPLRRGSSLNSNQRKLFNCPSHWPWIQPGQRGAYQGKSIMSPEVSCLLRSSQRHLKSCWINFICRTCLIICHQGSADESYTYDIQHS